MSRCIRTACSGWHRQCTTEAFGGGVARRRVADGKPMRFAGRLNRELCTSDRFRKCRSQQSRPGRRRRGSRAVFARQAGSPAPCSPPGRCARRSTAPCRPAGSASQLYRPTLRRGGQTSPVNSQNLSYSLATRRCTSRLHTTMPIPCRNPAVIALHFESTFPSCSLSILVPC